MKPIWGIPYFISFPDWTPPSPICSKWITFWQSLLENLIASHNYPNQFIVHFNIKGKSYYKSDNLSKEFDTGCYIWMTLPLGHRFSPNETIVYIKQDYFNSIDYDSIPELGRCPEFIYHTRRWNKEWKDDKLEPIHSATWIPEQYIESDEEEEEEWEWGYGDSTEKILNEANTIFESLGLNTEPEIVEQSYIEEEEPDEDIDLLNLPKNDINFVRGN